MTRFWNLLVPRRALEWGRLDGEVDEWLESLLAKLDAVDAELAQLRTASPGPTGEQQ